MSSHSSRYPPYSRSPSPSIWPSDQRHLPLSGHHDYLSPTSTRYYSAHPTTNSAPGNLAVPPLLAQPPISTEEPLAHSNHEEHSVAQPPYSIPRSPGRSASHPPMEDPDQDPPSFMLLYPPPSPQFLYAVDESVVIYTPDTSTHGSYLTEERQFQLPKGQPSRQWNRATFHRSHTPPRSPEQPSTSQHSRLPQNDGGTPIQYTGNQTFATSTSRHQSTSGVSMNSAGKWKSASPSPTGQGYSQGLEVVADQDRSSTLIVPPVLSPLSQRQVSAFREQSLSHHQGPGTFSQASNFVVQDSLFIDNNTIVDDYMKEFLQHTIIGAEFDSSDRDPPPRCHPGTRLAIVQRCLDFIHECHDEEKVRWVVGPAGVGKSAVMQIVAEKAPEGVTVASVFLSVNGRRDGTKVIVTIAYQLAVKCEPYNQFIRNVIIRDPSLLEKSLSVHFQKFIIEPFIHQHLFDPQCRFLTIIDGLDECDNPLTQQTLLELISNFCITYPTSPIAWIVASRPEPHLTSFFERVEVQPSYVKEEIIIDSDEACEDVQRYLRDELQKTKLAYPSLRRQREWPSELEFTKIATAAGGLFAYASTVARYICDHRYRDPATQLHHVLEVIHIRSQDDKSRRNHPMALLDALYTRILSDIPEDVMINTRNLLLLHSIPVLAALHFRGLCNLLGLTENVAYGAIGHLHAVARIPEPNHADFRPFEYFHKSFQDFLFDFKRSRFSRNFQHDARALMAQTLIKIIQKVPLDSGGLATGEGIDLGSVGKLKGGPGLYNKISLSWPSDERFQETDDELRLQLYRLSMTVISSKVHSNHGDYVAMSYFHALTTRFIALGPYFPCVQLRQSVFRKFRPELKRLGKLKRVPLWALDFAGICGNIDLWFASPTRTDVAFSDHWNPSCKHVKQILNGLQQWRGWSTQFGRVHKDHPPVPDMPGLNLVTLKECHQKCFKRGPVLKPDPTPLDQLVNCGYCLQRFARHFNNNVDQLVNVFVDATELCYVEFSFVDPDDGVSEWTYHFFHSGLPASIDV